MIRYIFLFAFSLLLLSCGESTSESQADEAATSGLGDLTNEVMAVHDEAMAKMGEVQQLMQALDQKANELQEAGEEKAASAMRDIVAELNDADRGMREWMRGYDPSAADPATEGAEGYLKNQLQKIEEVRENMFSAIQKGQAALSGE